MTHVVVCNHYNQSIIRTTFLFQVLTNILPLLKWNNWPKNKYKESQDNHCHLSRPFTLEQWSPVTDVAPRVNNGEGTSCPFLKPSISYQITINGCLSKRLKYYLLFPCYKREMIPVLQ